MKPVRTKDEQKKQALFKATVKLVNTIGFAASSVSKIAKEARVSPSTLYVFFDNKEDLLVSTYVAAKHRLSEALLADFNDALPIRDIMKEVWFNAFHYIGTHLDEYDYMEQFANSPYSSLVDRETLEKEWLPIVTVIRRGIELKIIKDADIQILWAFMAHPVSRLANPRICHDLELDKGNLDLAFTMAWDAIKL